MQRVIFRLSGVFIILLLVLCSGVADVCFGGFLAEDSVRFATYWNLLEIGEAKAAQDSAMTMGGEGHGCAEQMANFLLAWRASTGGDYASVPVYVELGVPAELTDYALWLRADALNHAGHDPLAVPYWTQLAEDSGSVLCADALLNLTDYAFDKGLLDDCLSYSEAFLRQHRTDTDDRQHVKFVRAQALAILGRHIEAVDGLWDAYSEAPLSGEASRVRTLLDNYPQRYGFMPRRENPEESAREYAMAEQHKQYALGLERAEQELKTIQPQRTDEVLRYFKGRFEEALSHRRECVETLQAFLHSFPQSDYRYKALYYLGRAAYLTDQDAVAIPALTEAGNQTADAEIAGKALDLLGALYLDRNRPTDAVTTYQQWDTVSKGTSSSVDCLWKLGRALWEAGRWHDAEAAWKRLYDLDTSSDYAPAALYWCARAAANSGEKQGAARKFALLESRFPYSYNAIIAPKVDSVVVEDTPLACPSLDDLWETGGPHCKKLAMLSAMRISDLALRELPLAMKELPEADGLPWWKAQHLLWQGKRMAAWRVQLTELGTYLRTAGPRPTAFTALAYPLDFDPDIVRLAKQYNLDPYFVFGLICQESHFEEGIVSPAGATGLMQLMPKTAYTEARSLGISFATKRLRDPDYNLRIGMAHLARLFSDFNRDTVLILAAYNAGPSAAQSWVAEYGKHERDEFIEHIPYRETRMYVKRNIEHAAAYRRLYPDVVTNLQAAEPQVPPAPPKKARATYGVHKRRAH